MDGVARADKAPSTDLASEWRPRGSAFVPCVPKAGEEASAAAAEKPQPSRVVLRKPVSFSCSFLWFCLKTSMG